MDCIVKFPRLVLTLVAASFAAPLHADPFSGADWKLGRKYFEEAKCDACHASIMGGEGSRIFTRPEHKIRDAEGLVKMVRFCVERTGTAVFPEDIKDIAAYLNKKFYKFK